LSAVILWFKKKTKKKSETKHSFWVAPSISQLMCIPAPNYVVHFSTKICSLRAVYVA